MFCKILCPYLPLPSHFKELFLILFLPHTSLPFPLSLFSSSLILSPSPPPSPLFPSFLRLFYPILHLFFFSFIYCFLPSSSFLYYPLSRPSVPLISFHILSPQCLSFTLLPYISSFSAICFPLYPLLSC